MKPLRRLNRALWTHEQIYLLALAIGVGLLGGYGAVGFRWLIAFFQGLAYGDPADILHGLANHSWLYRLMVPAAAGAIVGPTIYFLAREAKGHGVPEVMLAVALEGGRIRKRIVFIKSLVSALSIGAGGSVGREGPIVQIGSAVGSSVGQLIRVSPNRMRVLVGCGAAAGIAATFNAPVAGMVFSLEIILGEFAITTFSPIVVAAVMATAISRHYLGDFPAFIVPHYELVSHFELLLHAGLGLAAGLVALAFTTSLYKVEDLFDAWKIPEWLKTPAAGLALGGLGLIFPWVMGVGYEGIDLALLDRLSWWLMLLLVGIKILATSLTIGGGMSGGIFAPSLFMGAMLGGAFGHLVNLFFPEVTAGPGAYAIVGMAAVVAGTTHGPLSAFLILFEMTGDYKIILPLMIACILSTLLASRLKAESIYTLKLLRRGINIRAGKEMNLLRSLKVSQAMQTQVDSVAAETDLGTFIDHVARSKHSSFPVVGPDGRLSGIISYADYAEDAFDPNLRDIVVVGELATREVETVTPEDSLETALSKISTKDYATLPVVAGPEDRRLVGIISRRDIISVYSRQLGKSRLPD